MRYLQDIVAKCWDCAALTPIPVPSGVLIVTQIRLEYLISFNSEVLRGRYLF